MPLRRVPGALALGLLACLVAHTALFGNGHEVGGAYHALLIQAALAAGLSLTVFFAALAWSELGLIADGSVVATRLRERLPDVGSVIAAAAGWYVLAEAIEPPHAGTSPFVAVTMLVACAWLILRLATGIASAVSATAFAVRHTPFTPRVPSPWHARPSRRSTTPRRLLLTRRRFARPPPIVA